MRNIAFCLGIVVAAVCGVAQAQQPPGLMSMVTGDDSRGWEAVGRLDVGRSGFCTAAMIGPDLVLTAAHCLYDPETKRLVDASEIEFLAGWRNGRATAYRGIRRAIPHPDYRPIDGGDASGADNDVAVLQLDRPIRKSGVTPFQTALRPRKGDVVGVVSYAHNRSERPSIEQECHVLARPSQSLVLSCSVDFGSSGSPVFVLEGGEARIVSVVSAKAHVNGRSVSLGSGLEAPLADIRKIMSTESDLFQRPEPAVRRLTIEESRGGGAKFLRP